MRDSKRIKPFLKELEDVWKKNPDLRFYQLISAITEGKDLFYMEDKDFLKLIKRFGGK